MTTFPSGVANTLFTGLVVGDVGFNSGLGRVDGAGVAVGRVLGLFTPPPAAGFDGRSRVVTALRFGFVGREYRFLDRFGFGVTAGRTYGFGRRGLP